MPLTATHEEIQSYQKKVEKGKITSDGLDPYPRCKLEPGHFKIHAFRERRFLIIAEMLVEAVYATLVRFKCGRCGKTFAFYPDLARGVYVKYFSIAFAILPGRSHGLSVGVN